MRFFIAKLHKSNFGGSEVKRIKWQSSNLKNDGSSKTNVRDGVEVNEYEISVRFNFMIGSKEHRLQMQLSEAEVEALVEQLAEAKRSMP